MAFTDCDLGVRARPQIAWVKMRALQRPRNDREQEVLELNSKLPVR